MNCKKKAPEAEIIQKNLSVHSTGIPFAITHADFGIADTGTLVINSKNMDKRLATMIPLWQIFPRSSGSQDPEDSVKYFLK